MKYYYVCLLSVYDGDSAVINYVTNVKNKAELIKDAIARGEGYSHPALIEEITKEDYIILKKQFKQ